MGLQLYFTGKCMIEMECFRAQIESDNLVSFVEMSFLVKRAFRVSKTMSRQKVIYCNKRGCTLTRYPRWINVYACILTHYLLAAPSHFNYIQICSLWVFFMTLMCIALVCVLSTRASYEQSSYIFHRSSGTYITDILYIRSLNNVRCMSFYISLKAEGI